MPMHVVCTGALMNCMVSYMARPADTLPPGELMYRWIGFSGLSASRNSSCAMMMFATSSLIGDPRNTMRSISKREKMSYVRSPRLERSMIYGM